MKDSWVFSLHENKAGNLRFQLINIFAQLRMSQFGVELCLKFALVISPLWIFCPKRLMTEKENFNQYCIEFFNLLKCTELYDKDLIFNKTLTLNDTRFLVEDSKFYNFPRNLFFVLPSLQHAEVTNCGLNNLRQSDFENGGNLISLKVTLNDLEIIPSKVFVHLTNVKEIDLSNNKIRSLDPQSFFNLTNLEKLILHHNKIAELPEKLFEPVSSLKLINLDSNELAEFFVKDLKSLVGIRLNNNRFTDIKNLTKATNLLLLDISSNAIKDIDVNTFEYFKNLEILYTSNNNISYVNPKMFDLLKKLKVFVFDWEKLSRGNQMEIEMDINEMYSRRQKEIFDIAKYAIALEPATVILRQLNCDNN